MATTSTSIAVTAVEPVFTEPERLALAGFLAGYTGLTREAYALDLRQYACWCQLRHLRLFQARRADIECFARDLETRGRARATIIRRLCTVAGFYKYALEEELLEHSPAAHVRRPRLDYESHATGLDRNELRRAAGRRRTGATGRACAYLTAGPQRAPRLRSYRRRYRSPGHRTRAPDPGDHPQRRQGRHHPARAAHGPGDRPGDRRAQRPPGLPDPGRSAAGPARRRADCPPYRPPRRDHQARRPAHAAARVHHRSPRRGGPAAGCPG